MGVQIPVCEGAILRAKGGRPRTCPGHVQWLIYSKLLSNGQNRYVADDDRVVLDMSAHWLHLANTIPLSVCGGDAALC